MDKTIYCIDEKGLIHFNGDDVYGDYTVAELDRLMCELWQEFLEARDQIMKGYK